MSDLQKHVQEAVDQLVESGAERGVQVAVYRHGELAVDAVAGVADPGTGRPVTSGTPFYSTSTGKGVTATVVHVLAERGALSYDTPIAELWPEFGAHGKEAATVRHALTHSTGVPGLPVDVTPEDFRDWDRMCALIADAAPWWEPGTRTGYHAQTFGWIIGEIVRRATGRPISQILREEVAGPLGVADELFFGVPESELGRLARLEDAPSDVEMSPEMLAEIPFFRVVHGYTAGPLAVLPDAAFGNRADMLTTDIPAGGTMSARAVARMYAALLGEVDGVRLVSPERLREITAVAVTGVDELFGGPVTRALGYDVSLPWPTAEHSPAGFGMSGSGGTAAYADTATGTTFALTKNISSAGDFSTVERIGGIVAEAVSGG
ncbi:CubicO group peptidase (beta-lactamase class C family) [Streptosporangium album]|uniref:CubicO group peptidase (Beta-lactamase class C family) n=1 Tax=Streptosporangium album TaxID=47479 RepID=A0A7W7W8F1_9ACTN|nr:serine hydrolase domain-containing protein [Streptosporangium album]MBB4937034.1 CubicO group peptidase (beta-lactamase class C family) [Streptosporangium album]